MIKKLTALIIRISNIGVNSNDEEIIRIRKAVIVTSVVFGGIPVYLIIGFLFFFHDEQLAGIITIIGSVLMITSIYTLSISRRFLIHSNFWIFLTLLINFFNCIILGGIDKSGYLILWALVAPTFALIATTPLYCIILYIYVFCEITTLILIKPFLRERNNLSGMDLNILTVINIIGFAGFFLLSLYHYITQNGHLLNIIEVERNTLKLRNDIIKKDLDLARKLQEKLIPISPQIDFIYSLYKPMVEVGGDFYDFIKFRGSDRIGIFISDVSGHGVSAAFVTTMIKTTLLQSGNRKENPSELMHYINDVLQNQTDGNFITAFYCIFDPDERTIIYTNAGHPQPYLITGQGVSLLEKGKNTALAMFTNDQLAELNKSYINFKLTLPEKSKLLLYTDGLTEATPVKDTAQMFEDIILNEFCVSNRNLACDLFIKSLYDTLVKFRSTYSFEDDVCMICLDIK